jgi:hypothetical protein
MDEALQAIKDAATGATGALDKQGEALRDLLKVYDGTGQATTDLSTATSQYFNNVVMLIAQIEQLKTALAGMFSDSIKQYMFATLDTQGQYQYLQADAAAKAKQLQGATDVDTINRLAQQINAEQQQAFGMLTPEQQKAAADGFIAAANKINDLAQKKLTDAEKAQEDKANSVLTAIKAAIDDAASTFAGGGAAAERGGAAAERGGADIQAAAAALAGVLNKPLVNS